MTAVSNEGVALRYAAEKYQKDREIVMKAVSLDSNAFCSG